MIANPLPALALGYGGENVKPTLEPVIEAVCDLDSLGLSVVGGIDTVDDRLRAIDREMLWSSTMVWPGSTRSDP